MTTDAVLSRMEQKVGVGELMAYMAVSIGVQNRPLCYDDILEPLPSPCLGTFGDRAYANPTYGSRGNEMAVQFIENTLVTFGLVRYCSDGRGFMLTDMGEGRVESYLEKHEADPEFLPFMPDVVEGLKRVMLGEVRH